MTKVQFFFLWNAYMESRMCTCVWWVTFTFCYDFNKLVNLTFLLFPLTGKSWFNLLWPFSIHQGENGRTGNTEHWLDKPILVFSVESLEISGFYSLYLHEELHRGLSRQVITLKWAWAVCWNLFTSASVIVYTK